ncbi:MAG: class I SAM-dependent methyltransferase [Eubacteriales bacterium]
MELSKRLQAVADLVSADEIVADIGTDHGYIPIYLVQSGKCSKVFAMDINEGPYLRAKQHVAGYGLSEQVITRQSDGMKALESGEASAIIIAGMGGGLVIKILEQDRRLWSELNELILQPQSELDKVRTYLIENNWKVIEEKMVFEDGKYYPMMRVTKGQDVPYSRAELEYGRYLLQEKDSILAQFIKREITLKEDVIRSLEGKNGIHIETRIAELKEELEIAYEVQGTYRKNGK